MINIADLKAVIFDLDGVITNTANIHANAWKLMFDTFLEEYTLQRHLTFNPMSDRDYKLYVDGRPRYEGAQNFLLSRGINLLYGTPEDKAGTETVCGLANRKNSIYLSLLREKGAQVYEDTIATVKEWRREGKKTAVISASKNCREVLARAGITDLFDTIVDGIDSQNYHLKGKPEPDIFLFAAKQLHLEPSVAAIVEDATAGVKAGKEGHFALVIGISRNGSSSLLYNNGADIVVTSLCDIPDTIIPAKRPHEQISSALNEFDKIRSKMKIDSLLLLLDYDGTLTPIVSRPEFAILDNGMRDIIRSISKLVTVAIVSGRDITDVRRLVGLDELYYAGSHGFEIEGPQHLHFELETAKKVLPELDRAENELSNRLQEIKTIIIERKKFSLAIHYRQVTDAGEVKRIHDIAMNTANHFEQLVLTAGKKVYELRPRIDWDKGKAVTWFTEKLSDKSKKLYPLYIGDDLTDEDAFREIKGWGTGILVGSHGKESFADYRLVDIREVSLFLGYLKNAIEKT